MNDTKASVLRRIKRHPFIVAFICICLFFVTDIRAFDDLALRYCASQGYNWGTTLAIYLGANVHADEEQALTMAALYGYTDVVNTLLDHGANIDVNHGVVLASAMDSRNAETVRLVLRRETLAPTCDPYWQKMRDLWLKEAQWTGNSEIENLVSSRLKPLSSYCQAVPDKKSFDHFNRQNTDGSP